MLLTITILFALSVSLSECFRFMERRKQQGQDVWKIVEKVNLNQLWHIFKGGYQLCFFGLIALQNWQLGLLGCSVFWIIHDIFTNMGLGLAWNAKGTTAFLGRIFPNFWVQFFIKIILLIFLIWLFF